MMPVMARFLLPGDQFKVHEDSLRTYTVQSRHFSSDDAELLILELVERPELVLPALTQVHVVRMVRHVEVPCIAGRHGPKPVVMLHDMATGSKPRAVVCGGCDEEITHEVTAAMKVITTMKAEKEKSGD